jgi:hypothetical protein
VRDYQTPGLPVGTGWREGRSWAARIDLRGLELGQEGDSTQVGSARFFFSFLLFILSWILSQIQSLVFEFNFGVSFTYSLNAQKIPA